MLLKVLKLALISALCRAEVTNSAGITGFEGDDCFSSRTIKQFPRLTSLIMTSTSSFSAASNPCSVQYSNEYRSTGNFLFLSNRLNFLWDKIGEFTTTLWACISVSSNMLSSGPIHVSRDITDFSLKESIGGLVTCAKRCLQLS